MYLKITVVLIMIISGCAFTDVNMRMPTGGIYATIQGGSSREVVVVSPFKDQRGDSRCGMQKNGFNHDTADAICTTDPATWISNLLTEQLRASGFSVVEETSPHKNSTLIIEGSLLKLFVEPLIGTWTGSHEADIHVKLIATSDNGLRAERSFFAKGVMKGALASTTPQFEESLRRATQEILQAMVMEIISLMNRYPELGSRNTNSEMLVVRVLEATQ